MRLKIEDSFVLVSNELALQSQYTPKLTTNREDILFARDVIWIERLM